MSAVMIWVFMILLAIAVPVAHAMLGGVAAALWLADRPLAVITQRLFSTTQSFPMLAVPFFILAGSLMMSGRFGVYLVNIARLLVGNFKGGLGQVSIIGSVMFGGVSGSAVADATAMGNALIPVQREAGYPRGFSAAINASSSTIAVLIPPSIPLILFGLVSNVSITDLFVAGILPVSFWASACRLRSGGSRANRTCRAHRWREASRHSAAKFLPRCRHFSCPSSSLERCVSALRRRQKSASWPWPMLS